MINGRDTKMAVRVDQNGKELSGDLILQNGNGQHTNGHHKEQASSGQSDQSSCDDELSDMSHHELLLIRSETPDRLDSPETIEEQEKKIEKANVKKDRQQIDEERKANGGRKIAMHSGESVKRGEMQQNGGGGVGELSSSSESDEEVLLPMALYQHRVRALVLALLVEPHFYSDRAAVEEVVSVYACI